MGSISRRVGRLGAIERSVDPVERGRLLRVELGAPLPGAIAAGQVGPRIEVILAADDVHGREDDPGAHEQNILDVRLVLAVVALRPYPHPALAPGPSRAAEDVVP